jgi:hypothetical protein
MIDDADAVKLADFGLAVAFASTRGTVFVAGWRPNACTARPAHSANSGIGRDG